MACEIQYYDLGYHPVYYDHDLGLVCQQLGGDVDASNQQCWGPDGVFIDGSTGLTVTFADVARCYGVDTTPVTVPGAPATEDPAVKQALDALTGAVNAVAGVVNAVGDDITNVVEPQITGLSSQVDAAKKSVTDTVNNAVTTIDNTVNAISGGIKSDVDKQAAALTTTVNNATASVSAEVDKQSAAVQSTISGIGTTISQAVGAAATGIEQDVNAASTAITTAISNETTALSNAITGIADGIVTGISNILNSLLPGLLDTLSANTAALSNFVSSLTSNLMTGTDLAGLVKDSVSTAMLGPAAPFISLLSTAITKPFQSFLNLGENVFGPLLDPLIDQLTGSPDLPQEVRGLLDNLRGRPHFWFILLLIPALTEVSHEVFHAVLGPFLQKVEQGYKALAQPEIPSLADLLHANRRGVLDPGTFTAQAHRLGYPDWAIAAATETTYDVLSAREYVELWYRGYLDDTQLALFLQRANLHPSDATNLINHQAFVPQPQDVIRFLMRDVYFPEFVTRFRMDDQFDVAWQTAQRDFGHVGVSQDTALNFWRAHWELPAITQGYNLYHRASVDGAGDSVELPDGTTIRRLIAADDLERLLRAQGIEPFWRQPLIDAAFRPLTRIDLRRAYAAGVISQSDVYAGYINLGYQEQDAAKLTDLTVKLADDAAAAKLEPWASGIRTKLMTAFEGGLLSEKSFRDGMLSSGFTATAVDDAVASALTVRATHRTAALLAGVKPLYVQDDWTADQARARLSIGGLDDQEANEVLALWDLDRELRADKVANRPQKEATKAEVLAGYEDSLLTREQATAMLAAMKLSDTEVGLALGLADHKIAKSALAAEVAAVRAQYVSGQITLQEASSALDGLMLTTAQRGAYLTKWQTEIVIKSKALGVADVKALHQQGIYTDDNARSTLRLEGYNDADISSLLALWNAEVAADKAKVAAKAKAAADRAAKAAADKAAKAAKVAAITPRALSAGDVAKAVTAGILTVPQALEELATLGYSPTDAAIYLTLQGVTNVAVPPETEPT